jgi:transketolase
MLSCEAHHALLQKALNIKKRFLTMYKMANAGHVGCSLSCAEILTFVRFSWMKESDELILSKGHAAAALYSLLAEYGTLSESEISTFYQNNTFLAAHPPAGKISGIPFATGSLGHGLSIAAGIAMASKFNNNHKSIFCLTSDGELNEGSCWEAALFIAHHQLNNVIWLIDRNRWQGFGKTEEVMKLEPLSDKLRAFGFEVSVADGHSFVSLSDAKENYASPKPLVLICNTVKGKGWKQFEDKLDCHYLPMKDDMYEQISREIELHYQTERLKYSS